MKNIKKVGSIFAVIMMMFSFFNCQIVKANATGNFVMPAVNEDAETSQEQAISGICPQGIAIISADNSKGEWQYWTGAVWYSIEATSKTNAWVMGADTKIRYIPHLNQNGTATLTYYSYRGEIALSGVNRNADITSDFENYVNQINTVTINITPVNDAPTIEEIGTNNQYLDFGGNQYVNLADLGRLYNNSFTFESWVKVSNFQTWSRIFESAGGPLNVRSSNIMITFPSFYMDPNHHIYFEGDIGGDGQARYYFSTPGDLQKDKWMHVAVVYDKASHKSFIYLNGQQKASGDMNLDDMPTNITRTINYLGKSSFTQDAYFQGGMRDVRFWSKAKTQSEIRSQMQSELTGTEPELAALYKLSNSDDGTVAVDSVNSSENGAIEGCTWKALEGFYKDLYTSINTPVSKNFRVSDVDGDEVTIKSVVSSDTSLVPDNNIVVTGTGEERTIEITPANNQYGVTTITVTVQDPNGGEYSSSFDVYVYAEPEILTQPENQTVAYGQAASFTVAAKGLEPFTYQWYKDGEPISGATNPTLTISNTTFADAGNYKCIVTNGIGSAESNYASLTVIPETLTPIVTPGDEKVTLAAETPEDGYTFYYTYSGTSKAAPNLDADISTIQSTTGAAVQFASDTDIAGTNGTPVYVQVYKVDTATGKIKAYGEANATPEALTYYASISAPKILKFADKTKGYSPLDAKDVTITNSGTGKLNNLSVSLSGENSGDFTITQPSVTSLEIEHGSSFSVKPNDGLAPGTYTATVTVTGDQGVSISFDVSFTVNESSIIDLPDDNYTTPAAVRIEGTTKVGETLTAQLKDSDTNNYTTSAAVTYEWYRLDNADSEFTNEIGSGKTYKLTASDLSKYIGVRVRCGEYTFEYVVGRIAAASSSSSHHHHSTTTDTSTTTETKKDDNKTGWTEDKNDTNDKYYLNDDGSKIKGWKLIDNIWYFFNNRTGAMVRGWYKSEPGDWNFDKNDTVGQWFHLEPDGKLTRGWYKDIDGNWYYLCNRNAYGALGVMLTGWQHIEDKWYYFNGSGVMASNAIVDGYTLGSDGAWVV